MQIAIFEDLTTEQALVAIEKEAAKYDGLYVEMSNDKERKFVKGQASNIGGLLKKLEVARIEKTKIYRVEVEAEATEIKERLVKANIPFTTLIDEYKEKCARKLADERAIQAAKDLAVQIEEDHSDAITLDKMRTFETEDEIRQQKERDEQIAKEASEQYERSKELAEERAEQAEQDKILAEAKAKRDAKQAEKDLAEAKERAEVNRIEAERQHDIREAEAAEQAKQAEIKRQVDEKAAVAAAQRKIEANKKHVGAVRGEIKEHLMATCKIDESLAVKIVKALLKTDRVKIIY